jgi:hypothetical protein
MGHSGDEIIFTNGYGDTISLGGDNAGNDLQISISAPEERNTISFWNTLLGVSLTLVAKEFVLRLESV